jgi:hypothetical protein
MPSIIEVRCKCGKNLRAKSKLAGKIVRCPNCQTQLRIPDQTSRAAEDTEPSTRKVNTPAELEPDPDASSDAATSESLPIPESNTDNDTPQSQSLPGNAIDAPTTEGDIGGAEDDESDFTLQPLESEATSLETAPRPTPQQSARAQSYRRVDLEYADDVLAQSWKIFTKNARPILTAAFLFWFLPVFVVNALGSLMTLTEDSFGGLKYFYLRPAFLLAMPAVIGFFAYPVMIYMVAGTLVGSRPTLAESWEFIKPRMAKLVGTQALVFAVWAVVIVLEVCLILSLGHRFATIVFFLLIFPNMFVHLSLKMTIPAVVCEGISGMAALKRSFTLMQQYWMMLWAIYFLLWVVSIVVGGFTAGIFPSLLAPIASLGIQAVMQAFTTTVLVSLYFSSRASMEEFSVASMREDLAL